MNTQAGAARYKLDPHARFRVVDGEGIFVLQESGEVLVVNQVAAFIVQQLQDGRGFEDTIAAITERYAVDPELARTDAASLLEALREAGAMTLG